MAHRLSRGSSIDHNEKPNIILFLPTLLNKRAFYPMTSPISKFTTYWWKFSDSIIVHPKFFQVYQTTNNSWLLKKKFIMNQSKAKTEKTKINTLQESSSQLTFKIISHTNSINSLLPISSLSSCVKYDIDLK